MEFTCTKFTCWTIRDGEEEQRNYIFIKQLLSEVYDQSAMVFACVTQINVFLCT